MNITLKQLRYFDALVRHQHFGHAAEACTISQPALSVQIKELEAALGTPLFERGPRQVRPTAFGDVVAGKVADILQAIDDLADVARSAQGNALLRLRLGVIPTIAPYLLPQMIARLSAAQPDMDLRVRETVTPRLVEELHDGKLDTAIVALPLSEPSLTETPLFDEALLLVRPKADAERPVPNRQQLRDMRLLLLEEGHCFRDQSLSFCGMQSALSKEQLDGSSLSTLVQMVGAGIGVTLIPEMAVAVETPAAAVVVDRFGDPQPSRTVGMVWRKSNPLGAALAEIADIVRGCKFGLTAGAT